MDRLSVDIIFNIFSRLPIKPLLQLRCVSKLWCTVIDDPFLANLHLTQTIEENSVLVLHNPTHKKEKLAATLYLVKEDGNKSLKASKNPISKLPNLNNYSLQGSCNGLLYFANSNDTARGVFVLNPFTGQSKTLPPATIKTRWPQMKKYGLGYDFSTNTYKIVRIVLREINSTSLRWAVEVHTLGRGSWREINEVPLFPLCGRPVSAYGALHWIIDPLFSSDDDDIKFMIISFDINKEEFKFTAHPEFGSKTCDLFHLVDLGGCLAMVDLSSDTCIDIWVVKDYDKKEWVREYRISIKGPAGWPDNSNFKVIGLLEHGEIFLSYNEEYYCYNPKSDEIRYIHTPGLIPADTSSSEVYIHRGSLVSCNT